jgi:hypothetical protein
MHRDSLHSWLSAIAHQQLAIKPVKARGPVQSEARQAVVVKTLLGNPQPELCCCYHFSISSIDAPMHCNCSCCSAVCKALIYPPVLPSASSLACSVYPRCQSQQNAPPPLPSPPPPTPNNHSGTYRSCPPTGPDRGRHLVVKSIIFVVSGCAVQLSHANMLFPSRSAIINLAPSIT